MSEKTNPIKKRRAFVSLRVKLLGGLTLLFSALFIGAFFWFSQLARDIALRRLEEDLVGTLEGATERIDTEALTSLRDDAFAIAERAAEEAGYDWNNLTRDQAREIFGVAAEQLAGDPRYEALLDIEQEIQSVEPRAWPYLYVPGPGAENAYVAVADLWIRYDPDRAFDFLYYGISTKGYLVEAFTTENYISHPENYPLNSLEDIWGRIRARFQPDEEAEPEPILDEAGYRDEWGTWITAYAPVRDENGESLGALGIDFRADYVSQVTGAIQRQVLVAFGIGYVTLLGAAFLVASAFARPISSLAASAERIGEGQYDVDIADMSVGPWRDELTVFSDVFEIMIGKVHKREENLRRQVEELRIQIDEKKRGEQVAEIVESEFFKELRTKARTMRARGTRTDRGDE